MEYYSVLKENEILIRPATWANLENMLSERRTNNADSICMCDSIEIVRMGASGETCSRGVVARGRAGFLLGL